ncbi:MAG: hypothetical protein LBH17_06595, partial [Oscillospiraceae bacterium]|nr:hypothetical protein [Oscillospiraceae bacterium]
MTQSQSRTQSRRGSFYPAVISAVSIIATAIFTLIFSTGAGAWAIAPAVLIVLSEIVKGVTDAVIPRLVTSRGLPRLALRGGVPSQARTIVIITALLSSPEAAREAAGRMERYSITNRDAGENLVFGLLADLPEAQAASAEGDAEIIAAAQQAVAELRRRAGDGFFLFLRRRERAREGVFRGWERKRGAVCQLMRALRGGDDIDISDAARRRLGHIQYVIAIDADTRLTAGAAAELIGTIHHPSNRPVINPETRTVTRGHGIIQPRIVTALRDADATALARAFSGGGGVDIYGGSRGEIYQDISGKSSFVGKGIIDVDAYLQCLDGRLPSNRVLSHDLPEGAYLRCGFAGDITLTDSHPATAAAYYERLHRWTRGDWQNAPWLLPRVPGGGGDMTPNPMDCIDKWRVLDNLRRSLLPPCALAIILLCFNSAQYRPAAAAAAVALVFGHIMAAAGKIRHILIHLRRAAARLLLLPIEAGVYISAAAIALFRMTVTKRRLLQWVTAADSDAVTRRGNITRCLRLALAGVLAALAAGAVSVSRGDAISAALCAVWCLSPVFAAAMSGRRRKKRPPARRRAYLLRSARAAYRYFTDFITAENNFLPP